MAESNEFHDNWHLVFGDDGSPIPGRPIVEEVLKNHLDKVTFVNSGMSLEDKVRNGISIGSFANRLIEESDSDIAVILCDDDELVPTYLRDLCQYFRDNPSVLYCYSKVHLYNPLLQRSHGLSNITGKYNQWNGPIDPVGKLDASQVAWRLECCKKHGAWFGGSTNGITGKPWASDTDRSLFQQLRDKCGLCHPTGLVAQYKGVHDYQLVWHKNVSPEQLIRYDKMCSEQAGVKL